jgi:hypothetical protein
MLDLVGKGGFGLLSIVVDEAGGEEDRLGILRHIAADPPGMDQGGGEAARRFVGHFGLTLKTCA